jgi:carbon monoxide dehydrogenase subunit G
MKSIKSQKTIAASVEEVFAFVADLKNSAKRIPSISGMRILTRGKVKVGTKFRQTRSIFGTKQTQDMEIVEFDPPLGYAARAETLGCELLARIELKPVGEKTRVRAEVRVTVNGLAARLAAGMVLKGAKVAMKEDLEAMKAALETG